LFLSAFIGAYRARTRGREFRERKRKPRRAAWIRPRLLFRMPRGTHSLIPSFVPERGTHSPVPGVHSCTSVFQYKQLASEFSPSPRASDFWSTWRRCFCLWSRPRGLSTAKILFFSSPLPFSPLLCLPCRNSSLVSSFFPLEFYV